MSPETKKPRAVRRRASEGAGFDGRDHATAPARRPSTARPPANWRDRLPDPASYYAQHVQGLTQNDASGWARGACPLHQDNTAGLRVHVTHPRGMWQCDGGCGAGDLVGFHMRRHGLDFKAAVRDLVIGGAG